MGVPYFAHFGFDGWNVLHQDYYPSPGRRVNGRPGGGIPGEDGITGMKVILKQEVKNLGKEWDVVTVADGYARNYLLPRKLAMTATGASVKDLDRRRQQASVRREHEQEAAQIQAQRIEAISIVITAKSGPEGRLYGSVTPSDIADYLKGHGVEVDRRRVHIIEPIRTIGEHHLNIELYSNVSAHVRVQVNPEGGMPAVPPAAEAAPTTEPEPTAGETATEPTAEGVEAEA